MKVQKYLSVVALGFIAGFSPLISGCSQQNASAQEAFATISGDEAKKMLAEKNVTILDVRTPEEFATGHIENAINIDFLSSDFDDKIAQLPKDKTYVLYCRSGNRSGKAMSSFQKQGFTSVKNVSGGYSQLK